MSILYGTYLRNKVLFLGKGRFNFSTEIELDKENFIRPRSIGNLIHEVKNKMTDPYLTESEKEGLRMLLNFLERNKKPA